VRVAVAGEANATHVRVDVLLDRWFHWRGACKQENNLVSSPCVRQKCYWEMHESGKTRAKQERVDAGNEALGIG
jgi:hypothetical protein